MKNKIILRVGAIISGVLLFSVIATAQQPTASPKSPEKSNASKKESTPTSLTSGEDAGDYKVTATLEFGYRGLSVDGDLNKYKSDLNYKAGPRVFDSTLLLQAKEGK